MSLLMHVYVSTVRNSCRLGRTYIVKHASVYLGAEVELGCIFQRLNEDDIELRSHLYTRFKTP